MDPAREWTIFVGGAFALMGGSLLAGAEQRAKAVVVWENERRRLSGAEAVPCSGPFLDMQVRLNLAVGAAAALAGAALAAAALRGWVLPWRPAGAAALAFAAVLVAAGLAGLVAQARGRASEFPRGEPLPLRERAVSWLAWVLRAWWLVYGARLLWGPRS